MIGEAGEGDSMRIFRTFKSGGGGETSGRPYHGYVENRAEASRKAGFSEKKRDFQEEGEVLVESRKNYDCIVASPEFGGWWRQGGVAVSEVRKE